MNALTGALRSRGSRGVHLRVNSANHRAAAFYEYLGFSRLPAADSRAG